MKDLDVIKLWCERVKVDLPYQRFIFGTIGGLKGQELEDVINRITPELLVELYKNEE